jgi:NADH:ubiquinone oxidoreductase subunit 2 (subunit N)
MRATVAYTTARILLFVAAAGLIYLAGARGLLLIGLALLLSGAASYVLLSRQRDAMAGALSRRLGSFRSRLDDGARAEDRKD